MSVMSQGAQHGGTTISHVAKITLQIKSLDALARACAELGLELVHGQTTYRWYGQSIGDYPLPEGVTADDLGKCDHAIRIPGKADAYEIGVVKSKDGSGYTLLWDFYKGGYGLQDRIGEGAKKLKQAYSSQVVCSWYQKQGYRVTRTVKPDGKIAINATK